MSTETIPIFVVGSGRSGTRTIYKLLSGIPHIEIHHEFVCTHIQKSACMYFMGLIDDETIKRDIQHLHGSAIFYSTANNWVDCSNKLSWIIQPLSELYPEAKFVHLVRDGRKVASSYYHKLNDEVYDDESVRIMQAWLSDRQRLPIPPPEKKYWWNIPRPGQPFADVFSGFDQFQRACYQWHEANRVVMESLRDLPAEKKLFVRLEELISSRQVLETFLEFFDVEYEDHYAEFLKTPQNVIFPMDFKLSERQNAQFDMIAADMMERLGYAGKEEYGVDFGAIPPTNL